MTLQTELTRKGIKPYGLRDIRQDLRGYQGGILLGQGWWASRWMIVWGKCPTDKGTREATDSHETEITRWLTRATQPAAFVGIEECYSVPMGDNIDRPPQAVFKVGDRTLYIDARGLAYIVKLAKWGTLEFCADPLNKWGGLVAVLANDTESKPLAFIMGMVRNKGDKWAQFEPKGAA